MGPGQHLAPPPAASLVRSSRFLRVLPGEAGERARAAARAEGGETFPAPQPMERTNLARPACVATVRVNTNAYSVEHGTSRAACEACGWHGPVRVVKTNAQDDADDHNGDGLDIPAAA